MAACIRKVYDNDKNIIHLDQRPPRCWGPRLQPTKPIGISGIDSMEVNILFSFNRRFILIACEIRDSEWMSDCCLTPIQQFFSFIMARKSEIKLNRSPVARDYSNFNWVPEHFQIVSHIEYFVCKVSWCTQRIFVDLLKRLFLSFVKYLYLLFGLVLTFYHRVNSVGTARLPTYTVAVQQCGYSLSVYVYCSCTVVWL